MQHKKYQRKYKFSLVFGPTLWGHHIEGMVFNLEKEIELRRSNL